MSLKNVRIFTSLEIVSHFVPIYFSVRLHLQPAARKLDNRSLNIQDKRYYYRGRYCQNSLCVDRKRDSFISLARDDLMNLLVVHNRWPFFTEPSLWAHSLFHLCVCHNVIKRNVSSGSCATIRNWCCFQYIGFCSLFFSL